MEKIVLDFVEIEQAEIGAHYTDGCSGEKSDCCTRVCTRPDNGSADSLQAWDDYLEVAAGVIQY